MIDEIIELKRKELLDELKRYEEFRKELEDFKKEKQQLEIQWEKLDEQHSVLGGKSLILMERRAKRFNIFQKLFSKKYKEYIKNMEEVKHIEYEKDIINSEIEIIEEEISNKQKVIEQIKDEDLKKRILTLQNRVEAIKMIILEQPQITENTEFMMEAIKVDVHFIKYDNSNNPELYLYVLETMKEIDGHQWEKNSEEKEKLENARIETLSNIQQEILNPKTVEDDKYKLPTKYIFEEIRKTFLTHTENIPTYLTHNPLEFDGIFPKEYGEELEKMWEDEENYYAVHGISRNYESLSCSKDSISQVEEKIVRSIFKNGIRATSAMQESVPMIEATIYIKHPTTDFSFIDALDYSYAGTYGFVICQIPKDGYGQQPAQAVWGTDASKEYSIAKDDQAYLLPKYIKGFVRNNKYVSKGEYQIMKNDEKPKKYQHFIIDRTSKIYDSEHPFEKEI